MLWTSGVALFAKCLELTGVGLFWSLQLSELFWGRASPFVSTICDKAEDGKVQTLLTDVVGIIAAKAEVNGRGNGGVGESRTSRKRALQCSQSTLGVLTVDLTAP